MKSGNGFIVFTTESTNGCSNNAMKFVKVPSPDGFYLEPYTNVNYFTGANSDASGALIFAAGSPSWKQWCFLGNSGCP